MNFKERVQPDECALIIVDVQNDFCDLGGACARRGSDLSAVPGMMAKLTRLIDGARNSGVPVIFIRTEHDELTDSAAWNGRYGQAVKKDPSELSCRTGSWGAELHKISPQEGEVVITKHRYSGFVGTNLNLILSSLRRRSLLFTGVATNICVESTLRDGLSHDYFVTLIEDCCAAYSAEDHDATVRNVSKRFGLVSKSEAVLEQFLTGSRLAVN